MIIESLYRVNTLLKCGVLYGCSASPVGVNVPSPTAWARSSIERRETDMESDRWLARHERRAARAHSVANIRDRNALKVGMAIIRRRSSRFKLEN